MAPVTIIVCGVPGTGKTTLAVALAPRLGISAFSTDQLEAAVVRGSGISVNE